MNPQQATHHNSQILASMTPCRQTIILLSTKGISVTRVKQEPGKLPVIEVEAFTISVPKNDIKQVKGYYTWETNGCLVISKALADG
jgi:hypothetical protein